MKHTLLTLAVIAALNGGARAQRASDIAAEVDRVYVESQTLYRALHQRPELSMHEEMTAATLAAGLRELGFEVTSGVGRTGVVGLMKNGEGPVIMLRTELDALPVEENTGLPYASSVRTKDDNGAEVAVMHACGHDLHMSAWMGTARLMAATRARWRGTLMLIGQPGEETGTGAAAMVADGLLTRFPRPAVALAVHDDARFASGLIGYHSGPLLTNSDSVTITIYGQGGHGARPETTVDPVVIAARAVTALQTIVARETSPFDPAVVTVGSIHGGTRPNIIPDEVTLQVSVRTFTDAARQRVNAAIERIVRAEAVAANASREPRFSRVRVADALVNDPGFTTRVSAALVRDLGADRVQDMPREMVSEDFSVFQRAGVPTLMLRVGSAAPRTLEAASKAGTEPPSLHSARFAPDLEPTLKTAISAEVVALRELMPAQGK
jgi:hippurate hydrolase